ncbi:MAG: hypothetical protein EOM05_11825, partial [Clostridia bacterium]|nr:hypothetical protein [Clostridia bacterium]
MIMSVVVAYTSYIAVSQILTYTINKLTIAQLRQIALSKKQVAAQLAATLTTKNANTMLNVYLYTQKKLHLSTNMLTKAFWKLAAAMAANPIAAAVAIGVGVTAIIGSAVKSFNSVENVLKRLNKTTSEYKILMTEVSSAIETYNEISNKPSMRNKDDMDKLNNAIKILSERYPDAIDKTKQYGDEVKIAADKVKELYENEAKLYRGRMERDYQKLLKKEKALSIDKKLLSSDIAWTYNLPFGVFGNAEKQLERVSAELDDVKTKADELYYVLFSSYREGDVRGDLRGVQEFVFKLESLTKRLSGDPIKLFDSPEDVSKYQPTELIEEIVKKYNEAKKGVEGYTKMLESERFTTERLMALREDEKTKLLTEKEGYEQAQRELKATMDLSKTVLSEYNMLYLLEDKDTTKAKTKQDILRDEINMVKDARDAYEAYLKTMTEVRAKQTVESQLKFAGLDFDISDAGAYREYLQSIYDR